MYIEQGYRGDLGLWKYAILPLGFIALMVFNYISMLYAPVSVDVMMQDLIDKMGSNLVLVLLLAPLAIGLVFLLGWVKLVHPQSITSLTTSRRKIDWGRVFFSFFLWGGVSSALILINVGLNPAEHVWNFKPIPFLFLAIIAIILIPLQTSFEEYMFRGYMMQGLGILVKNRWFPLLLTSVLFGLMHLGNPEVGKLGYGIMTFYIGTGLFLGIITLMDEGLELALGFHAANNLFTALLVTADWTAFQTHSLFKDISKPELGWDVLVPVFVIFPIFLWIFARKYNWTDWRERLTGRVMSKSEFFQKQP